MPASLGVSSYSGSRAGPVGPAWQVEPRGPGPSESEVARGRSEQRGRDHDVRVTAGPRGPAARDSKGRDQVVKGGDACGASESVAGPGATWLKGTRSG